MISISNFSCPLISFVHMSLSKCLLINEARALTGTDFKRMFEAALCKIPHKKSKNVVILHL